MKRPILNQIERRVLREQPDSLSAALLRLKLAQAGLKREFPNTFTPYLNKLLI